MQFTTVYVKAPFPYIVCVRGMENLVDHWFGLIFRVHADKNTDADFFNLYENAIQSRLVIHGLHPWDLHPWALHPWALCLLLLQHLSATVNSV